MLLPFWFAVGLRVTDRYLERLSCDLTERTLKVGKGFFVRVEKTVPLDKITDLGLVQGPIMRYLGIEQLTVETAGQSSQGALVRLVGVNGGRAFRDAVLQQRDLIVTGASGDASAADDSSTARRGAGSEGADVLREIRDGLLRIENLLAESRPETS